MKEKLPIYDDEGRVKDPKVARKMAEAEAPYHEKTLGIFSPSKWKIRKGEAAAEEALEKGERIVNLEDLPPALGQELQEFRNKYNNESGLGLFSLTGGRAIDYGEGKFKYRFLGIMTRHDQHGQFVGQSEITITAKVNNGEVVESFE